MRRLILPALALGLATLATQATMSASGPSDETEAGWFLLHEGSIAKLAYGLPETDEIVLMLACSPGATYLNVYGDVEPVNRPETDEIVLKLACSPGATYLNVYGDVEPVAASLRSVRLGPAALDPLTQGDAWDMVLALNDTRLETLVRRGRLPVRAEGSVYNISASRAERDLVRQFLGYCATRHA